MCLILLLSEDAVRGRAALSIALAESARGKTVTLFAQERAVALLAAAPRNDDETTALAAAGLPDRRAMLAMAVESGVALIACQTGLAITGLALDDLVPGVSAGGLMGVLTEAEGQPKLTV